MELRSKTIITLRHKSRFFTRESITLLQNSGTISLPDFISLMFLMCPEQQFSYMYNRIKNLRPTNFPGELNLFDEFCRFPDWERKLKEALERVNNNLALFSLNIRESDLSADDHQYCLNASRVVLYRVFEGLTQKDGEYLVNQMMRLGAPNPEEDLEYLELYFLFWHIKGFLNVDNQEGFEHVAESLRKIGQKCLSYTLGYPEQRYNRFVFHDDFPVEIYPIRDEKNAGLCLIINQVRYGGKETDRDSSLVDVGKLKSLMTSLNFFVIALEDVGAGKLCESIKSNIEEHFSKNHSIFMLVVMAHGEKGYLLCPESNMETVNEHSSPNSTLEQDKTNVVIRSGVAVKDIHNSVLECIVLKDVPKILILNACRGRDFFTAKHYIECLMAADVAKPPVHSQVDFITCYSTLQDFVSLRDKEKGSLFINVFCDVLSKKPDMEMCELFTLVNARLMQPTPAISNGFKVGRQGHELKLANPFEFTSSLTRKLYLKVPKQHN
uniref:Caspase-3 n=1 Tax=Lygus hesperus TaxID=30085 RepID=A0A0A9X8X4_LYGHE